MEVIVNVYKTTKANKNKENGKRPKEKLSEPVGIGHGVTKNIM